MGDVTKEVSSDALTLCVLPERKIFEVVIKREVGENQKNGIPCSVEEILSDVKDFKDHGNDENAYNICILEIPERLERFLFYLCKSTGLGDKIVVSEYFEKKSQEEMNQEYFDFYTRISNKILKHPLDEDKIKNIVINKAAKVGYIENRSKLACLKGITISELNVILFGLRAYRKMYSDNHRFYYSTFMAYNLIDMLSLFYVENAVEKFRPAIDLRNLFTNYRKIFCSELFSSISEISEKTVK